MAFYKLNRNGEAERVSYEDYVTWCGGLDMSKLVLRRHHIIDTKELGALAVEAPEGKRFKSKMKILSTVETKLSINTKQDSDPPWEVYVNEGGVRRWLCATWQREQAIDAHFGNVNLEIRRKGGRVLIRFHSRA